MHINHIILDRSIYIYIHYFLYKSIQMEVLSNKDNHIKT